MSKFEQPKEPSNEGEPKKRTPEQVISLLSEQQNLSPDASQKLHEEIKEMMPNLTPEQWENLDRTEKRVMKEGHDKFYNDIQFSKIKDQIRLIAEAKLYKISEETFTEMNSQYATLLEMDKECTDTLLDLTNRKISDPEWEEGLKRLVKNYQDIMELVIKINENYSSLISKVSPENLIALKKNMDSHEVPNDNKKTPDSALNPERPKKIHPEESISDEEKAFGGLGETMKSVHECTQDIGRRITILERSKFNLFDEELYNQILQQHQELIKEALGIAGFSKKLTKMPFPEVEKPLYHELPNMVKNFNENLTKLYGDIVRLADLAKSKNFKLHNENVSSEPKSEQSRDKLETLIGQKEYEGIANQEKIVPIKSVEGQHDFESENSTRESTPQPSKKDERPKSTKNLSDTIDRSENNNQELTARSTKKVEKPESAESLSDKVKSDAAIKIADGAFAYRYFVDGLRDAGLRNVDELINSKEIRNTIAGVAAEKMSKSFHYYSHFMDGWKREFGSDWGWVDKSQPVKKAIFDKGKELAGTRNVEFQALLINLKEYGFFGRESLADDPEFIKMIEAGAKKSLAHSQFELIDYINKCKDVGIEIKI
jgi:hypothetical protein